MDHKDVNLKRRNTGPVVLVFVIMLLAIFTGCAHNSRFDVGASPAAVFSAAIDIYQGPLNHLSAVRHGQCPMYPSCSQFGRQAIAKHGAVAGWVMAMDRLMRCGRSELSLTPLVKIKGQWRYYDPVADNDFWWHSQGPSLPDRVSYSAFQRDHLHHQ